MSAFFSPSLMCANYEHLASEIIQLENAGADRFHLDVMDGRFVPNFAMGYGDVKCICGHTQLKTELHLMIEEPTKHIDLFAAAGVDIIYIHPESDYHPATAIQKIIEAGVEPGIVLSPGTSIETVIELFHIVKHVMIMGVNPGHAGQIYLPYVDKKISKLIALKDTYGLDISIDGACTAEIVQKWSAQGVDGFVLGTAALFGKAGGYRENISRLRKLSEGIEPQCIK